MDSQPFRTKVTNNNGEQIGFVAWSQSDNMWRAYRHAGQPPLGKCLSKDDAINMVRQNR
jgi:hypothetical protein